MEKEFYNCKYCFKEFEPTRRRAQKFCSNTCRSKAHHAKKSIKNIKGITVPENTQNSKPTTNKVEKMSFAGLGNAAAGSLTADGLKHLFTDPKNRPATKADIAEIASKIKRYHKILNLPPNLQGALPYFDLETKNVIYSFLPLYG